MSCNRVEQKNRSRSVKWNNLIWFNEMDKSTTFHFEINVNMSHCTYLKFELMEQIIEMDHRFGQQSQCREGKRLSSFQWTMENSNRVRWKFRPQVDEMLNKINNQQSTLNEITRQRHELTIALQNSIHRASKLAN